MKKLLLLLSVLFVVSCSKAETIKYSLNVSSNPIDSGTVSPINGQFDEGQEITLIANPEMEFNFEKWTGSINATSNSITMIMNSDKTVVANFTPKTPTRARYGFTEVWKDKIEIPKSSILTSVCPAPSIPERYVVRESVYELRMVQQHHLSVDSLIVDFSKGVFSGWRWDNQKTKDLLLPIPDLGTPIRYIPSKIGYIKFIGDTINKRLFWEFKRYLNNNNLPILYGDSNIDFTDLIYEGQPICAPRKIKNNSEIIFFKKEDLTKNPVLTDLTFDANSNQGDWKVGDTIGFGNGDKKIHSIKYFYD